MGEESALRRGPREETQPEAGSEGAEVSQADPTEAWKEVGSQLRDLGASLADAFRAVSQDERNRERVDRMREGLEAMVDELAAAVREGGAAPEARLLRDQAGGAARAIRDAGAATMQEALPHVKRALRRVEEGIEGLHRTRTQADD